MKPQVNVISVWMNFGVSNVMTHVTQIVMEDAIKQPDTAKDAKWVFGI